MHMCGVSGEKDVIHPVLRGKLPRRVELTARAGASGAVPCLLPALDVPG